MLVVDVEAGGPAEMGGLRRGDIIVAKNGRPINGVRDLLDTIGYIDKPSLELTVRRGGQEQRVLLKLAR